MYMHFFEHSGQINARSVTTKQNFGCFSHISGKQGKTKLWQTFDISDRTFRNTFNNFGYILLNQINDLH